MNQAGSPVNASPPWTNRGKLRAEGTRALWPSFQEYQSQSGRRLGLVALHAPLISPGLPLKPGFLESCQKPTPGLRLNRWLSSLIAEDPGGKHQKDVCVPCPKSPGCEKRSGSSKKKKKNNNKDEIVAGSGGLGLWGRRRREEVQKQAMRQ